MLISIIISLLFYKNRNKIKPIFKSIVLSIFKSIAFKLLVTLTVILLSHSIAIAQEYDYQVDWSDTSTFNTDCGRLVSSQWSVKYDSCVMHSPYLRVEALEGSIVSFSFKINQSGNGDADDRCYIFHQIDNEGWMLDTLIVAGGDPAVFPYDNYIFLDFGHYIQFRVCCITNSKTEFWAIKGGKITATDNDISVRKIYSYTGEPPAPPDLPVELMTFNANNVNGTVKLNWSTASETNNDFFTIEKSKDGKDFIEALYVDGAGNSNSVINYSTIDDEPYQGISYYRLKQTDFDGKFTYSKMVPVNINNNGNVSFFPNPTKDVLNITLPDNAGYVVIDIYNINDSKVFSGTYSKESLNNSLITLDLKNKLGQGIYLVNITANSLINTFYSEKIIVY